jgi:hypothetical protein
MPDPPPAATGAQGDRPAVRHTEHNQSRLIRRIRRLRVIPEHGPVERWLSRVWEHDLVQWVGKGSELWRVRVDLIAPDHDNGRVPATHEALKRHLIETDGVARRPGDSVADQGIGREGDHPVVGLVFWLAADEIGQAATLAAETARRAGADSGVGTELYDVVVTPHAAIADRYGDHYPRQPD